MLADPGTCEQEPQGRKARRRECATRLRNWSRTQGLMRGGGGTGRRRKMSRLALENGAGTGEQPAL
jgi:hypothetical protein